jgi:hypothetical protein
VRRSIVGFHQDDVGDWIAELSCGHTVHVRHNPPWQERPWVVDDSQRNARIGTELECVQCDRGDVLA